jgi:hypothetical protein
MTRDDIIRLADESNLLDGIDLDCEIQAVIKFANLVIAAEREACAKVCDTYDVAEDVNSCDTAEGIAAAIRARSLDVHN